MEAVVHHLSAHEAALVAARTTEPGSCHALLRTPMYHYFKCQLEGLPDISARVAKLIRAQLPRATPHPSTPNGQPPAAPTAAP